MDPNQPTTPIEARADLDDLLEKTSRTFALSIPYLPEPTRREVTIAYLLFRISDTFEDSASWTRAQRIEALGVFSELLAAPDAGATARWARAWVDATPIEHAGYQELLAETPEVLEAFFALGPAARDAVRRHTVRTARGMAGFVERTDDDGQLRLRDLADLREYCYLVAGIVGEMLTELFLLDRPALQPIASGLRSRARWFGEGLQLVNILKDSAFDATEGRSYVPGQLDRAEVFALARHDLRLAAEYTQALQSAGAERGLVAFNALPVLLAFATLERVEESGPGTKITREQVAQLVAMMDQALELGLPVLALDDPSGE